MNLNLKSETDRIFFWTERAEVIFFLMNFNLKSETDRNFFWTERAEMIYFFWGIFDHFWPFLAFFSPLLGMLQKKYSSKNSLAANFQNNGVLNFP